MCTANAIIAMKVKELAELKKMQDDLQQEIDLITDQIKEFMGDNETMLAGDFTVTYKTVVSNRVDTAALTKLLGKEALAPYTKRIESRRFQIK